MFAGIVAIDSNRIRFSVRDWKSLVALKLLSSHVRDIVSIVIRSPHKALSYRHQRWMEIWQLVFAQAASRS